MSTVTIPSEAGQRMIRSLQLLCIGDRYQQASSNQPTLDWVKHSQPATQLPVDAKKSDIARVSTATPGPAPAEVYGVVPIGQTWRQFRKGYAMPTHPLESINQFKNQLTHSKLAYGQVMLDLHTRNKLTALMNEQRNLNLHSSHDSDRKSKINKTGLPI